MKVSQALVKFLARPDVEGWENHAYPDSAGYLTIGVGHKLTRSELSSGKLLITGLPTIRWQEGLTDAQVEALLRQDLLRFEAAVVELNILAPVPFSQPQFDAMVAFAFNVGVSAFRNSTLWKRVVNGQFGDVPTQMRRWVHAGGKYVQGLANRREKEIELWSKDD